MRRTDSTETDDLNSSTKAESILTKIPCGMSDDETENITANSVTYKEVSRQIKFVTNRMGRQLERICELMKELKDKQSRRSYEDTLSCIATVSFTGSEQSSDWSLLNNIRKMLPPGTEI